MITENLQTDLKSLFIKAVEANPKYSEAHLQLALLYQDEEDFQNVENHFNAAIQSDSEVALELDERGEELLKKFQFQNAKDQFMKVQEKKNHCANVYFQQSKYFLNQNKIKEALESLSLSIKMNPTSSEVQRDYGILLSQENQIDNARLHLEKSLDLNYGDSITHYQLGMIMVKMKDYEDAEQQFLSALDIDPELVECIIELAALKLDIDQKDEAKKYYEIAKNIAPDLKHSALEKIIN